MNNGSLVAIAKAYWRSLQMYYRTEKGRHDIMDYLRAGLIITALILVTLFLLRWIF